MTKDILFNNSNMLYDLRYEAMFSEIPQEAPKQLTYNPKSTIELQPQSIPIPMPSPTRASAVPRSESSVSPNHQSTNLYDSCLFPTPPKTPQVYDLARFDDFMDKNPDIKFVYIQWLDYMATMRVRVLPIKEFIRIIREGRRLVIPQGDTGTVQNSAYTPAVNTNDQIFVEPDLRSIRRTHDKDPLTAATVFSYWRSEEGSPLPSCPRNNLETLTNELKYKYDITVQVGFEIDVAFFSRNNSPNAFNFQRLRPPYEPVTQSEAWSTITSTQWLQMPILAEIAASLSGMGIDLQQFHAKSGPGQYEFVLSPAPLLLAMDTLIQTQQAIAQIATLHGVAATLHPKPFGEKGAGSATHAHISLQPPTHDKDFFIGGVLEHLPALCAFMMPDMQSYSRIEDDQSTGCKWVSWGTQNRDCPLRRVEDGRWELRCLDGLANMYFVMAGVVAAGMLGLSSALASAPSPTPAYDQAVAGATEHGGVGLEDGQQRQSQGGLASKELDVPVNPSMLDEQGRAHYGITRKMPRTFQDALKALEADGELKEATGSEIVRDWIKMKDYEQEMLGKMPESSRWEWLVARY